MLSYIFMFCKLLLFVPSLKIIGYENLCGLVVRVPGYRTEMYCASCQVSTECICYVEESRPPLWSSGRSPFL
jgi:hypothetical protein